MEARVRARAWRANLNRTNKQTQAIKRRMLPLAVAVAGFPTVSYLATAWEG